MTTTANLKIDHLVSNPTSPEVVENEAKDILDAVTTGQLVHDMASDADYTLGITGAVQEWHYGILKITDTGVVLTVARNIICPDNKKIYIIENATAQTLTFKTLAGSGIAVLPGNMSPSLWCDGTNVITLQESLSELDIQGPEGSPGTLTLSTAELTVVDGDELGRIDFQAPLESSGTDAILVAASIYAEADDTFAADNNTTDLVFATAVSEVATEKMRLNSAGSLIVGVAGGAPAEKLHVVGNIALDSGGVDDLTIQPQGSNTFNFRHTGGASWANLQAGFGVFTEVVGNGDGDTKIKFAGSDVMELYAGNVKGLSLSEAGGIAQVEINQGTNDSPFIDYQATADGDSTSAISTLTTSGATTHHIQVEINGAKAWIAVSTNNPS